jgi:murein DD-endopeptidase MepM/ murein hydrolase activator NlpD
VVLVVVAIALPLVILAFDSTGPVTAVQLPAGTAAFASQPTPQVVAFQGDLRLYLPVAQQRITAIGYHAVGDDALALDPVGSQANAGVFTRLFRRLFGESSDVIHYYLLGGGGGPETAGMDIGAPVGTDVYAPVDATVVGISDLVLDGRTYGARIDLQPLGSPGLVVTVTHVTPDQALTVGSTVAAARTRIGAVVDLSQVESSALARYTHDLGTHVHVEVRPTANLPGL